MNKKKKDEDLEEFKYLIDSRNFSEEERKADLEIMMKAREARFRKRTKTEILQAQLLQLKYLMKDYIEDNGPVTEPRFSEFLKTYVDALYSKRIEFAADLSIEPIVLSHILNNHRNPKDSFMSRLIIHSEGSYRDLGGFDRELWPRVYFKDKMYKFIASQEQLKESEAKYVRHKKWDQYS